MSKKTAKPRGGSVELHPRLAQLAVRRKQQRQEADKLKTRQQECEKWAGEYEADLLVATEAMDTLSGEHPSHRPKGFRIKDWVEPLLRLGEVVGRRSWQGVICGCTGQGAVLEIGELIRLVADGELDREGLRQQLMLLDKEGVADSVDWQYPLGEWRRGILGQFYEARSQTFPDLHPASRPQQAASGLPDSDATCKTETEPRAEGKPSESRMNDILTAIRCKKMPLTAAEIQLDLAMKKPGKLRANLSWMLKNEKLQRVVGKGYWLPDVPVPR